MSNTHTTWTRLPWDSEFFGFPVASLSAGEAAPAAVAAAIEEMRAAGIHLAYLIAAPADAAIASLLNGVGARLVDRKVTFCMQLPPFGSGQEHFSVSVFNSNLHLTSTFTRQAESLAWQSGAFSRFKIDTRFEPTAFQLMYSQWLRNSLNGSIARAVMVWRDAANTEQGLLTLGEKNGRADIGLLAVDAAVRGQGVGQQLVQAAARQAACWGYHELQVVTQGDNKSACAFYEKCGFTLLKEEHIYHLWLGDE